MPTDAADTDGFDDLDLAPAVHAVLHDLGYHTPSPIQQKIIPYLLDGRDVIGQAQTGTGKTAAFALPILSRLTEDTHTPQVLVLAPTRELANQVAEAFNRYSARMSPVRILPIYGGQDYRRQIRGLRDGVHIVVGTPGRVMDHMRKGTLRLDNLKTLVLDEADEMLRMGFIEDVEWILEHTPDSRQIALFSATMPDTIRRVAERYLNDPEHVAIETNLQTAETVTQLHCIVRRENKLEALTRFLEYARQ
jgi:ATP-dependent RNA helicase DeaD